MKRELRKARLRGQPPAEPPPGFRMEMADSFGISPACRPDQSSALGLVIESLEKISEGLVGSNRLALDEEIQILRSLARRAG